VFENYVTDVLVDGKHVELGLWDTAGQSDYDRLRPLSYPETDIVAIVFAIDSPDSLDDVEEKVSGKTLFRKQMFDPPQWIHEINHHLPSAPRFLIGAKKDLRDDPGTIGHLMKTSQRPVTYAQVCVLPGYVFCSVLTSNLGDES
jgi:Ras homolog gene family, member A